MQQESRALLVLCRLTNARDATVATSESEHGVGGGVERLRLGLLQRMRQTEPTEEEDWGSKPGHVGVVCLTTAVRLVRAL